MRKLVSREIIPFRGLAHEEPMIAAGLPATMSNAIHRAAHKGWFACVAFLTLGACGTEPSATADPTLRQVEAGAERYRDVKNAIADGYTTDNKCVTAAMLGFPAVNGDMGLHYVRRDLLGLPAKPAPGGGRVAGTGTYTDFAKPAMLVYEPQPDGSLELVAVENLVFASEWHKTREKPPQFRGVNYLLLKDDPATKLDEAHNFEPHYELHLWVFRDNPKGMYAPFNPAISCRHHKPPAPHA